MKKNNYLLFPSVFGVILVGKKNIAVNVVNSGKIKIQQLKNKYNFEKYNKFLLRGIIYLFFGLIFTLKGLFFNNNLQDNYMLTKTKDSLNISQNNIISFVIIVLSLIFSIFLLGFLPMKIGVWLSPKNFDILLKRIIIALCKIVLIYLVFLLLKFVNVVKEYYKFNSACMELQKNSGQVNFVLYFLFTTFLTTFVLSILGLVLSVWYAVFVNLFIVLFCVSVSYELLVEIQKINWLNKIFLPMYFLICEKPSQLAQKCAKIALSEYDLNFLTGDKMQLDVKDDEIAFSEAYVLCKDKLEKAKKFEQSDLDFIFCEVLNKKRAELRLVKSLSKSDFKKIEKATDRRAKGEPITKIFGHTNFYGLDFVVTKDVLSPRMDTEILVEQVLNDLNECKGKVSVIDIGTGSGAIAVTIAKLTTAKVTAVDVSDNALQVAKQNAEKNGAKVNFVKSDLFANVGKFAKFDIIVSNPPYIPTNMIVGLDEEVTKFDPLLALDGGADGLNFYRAIIDVAPKKLVKNGRIYLEVGINQAQEVKKLLQKNFKDIRIVKDYNKIERVVCATLN